MTRTLTSFAAAGALLLAGAGFTAAQAQGTWAAAPPLYSDAYYGGYGYGWGPGPIGAVLAAPAVAAAGLLGAAATVATAPFAAAGYYADPYYGGYYGAGYAPAGWGYNYGPTYVAWRDRPIIRRAAIITRGPYREVRAVRVSGPVRSFRAQPVRMRHINGAPVRMHRVEAKPAKIALAR